MGWIRDRRERRLAALDEFRQVRRIVEEDVTVFGEQLSQLHVETMTDDLSADAQRDYEQALASYDAAKLSLDRAEQELSAEHVLAVNDTLDEGRFRLACVLARRDGDPLPTRRESCFFNPQHGPGVEELPWTPPHGVERMIPVCRADLNRMTAGEPPEVRLVRVGDRYLPWYEARQTRGAFGATLGSAAASDAPSYARLEADIIRSIKMPPTGGSPFG